MIELFFLIRSLNMGGTERQLSELVKGLDKDRFNITVCLFYDEGLLRKEFCGIRGVKLLPLWKSGRWDLFFFGLRFIRLLKKLKPCILYSFLPEANLIALIAGRSARVPRIVWGLRASNMDTKRYHWVFGAALRICGWLSSFPDAIISNSLSVSNFHKSVGFDMSKSIVIPNGIDTKKFNHDRSAGYKVRKEWGVLDDEILIGNVARLDPMKDHYNFLRAAQILKKNNKKAKFVCVGDGPEHYKIKLRELGESLGLGDYIIWAGPRTDMPAVFNALNLASSSSSFGEGFPNVIGEAMACGLPCVVTDVGDSAIIVGDTGVVTPVRDPQALANGWEKIIKSLSNDSFLIPDTVRERISLNFSVGKMVKKTTDVLMSLP